MLTIFEELVSVAICSRSNLRSTGLICNGEKILSNVNVVVGGQVKSENSSLLVTVRVSKTRVL